MSVLNIAQIEGAGSDRRPLRADAQRNLMAVLNAAKELFSTLGTEVPIRAIADHAGVGVATIYRHYPRRHDLIAAVFRQELDACALAASELAAKNPPFQALAHWMQAFVDLAATKRGLAEALFSGDPAYDGLPERRERNLRPAMRSCSTLRSPKVLSRRMSVPTNSLMPHRRFACRRM